MRKGGERDDIILSQYFGRRIDIPANLPSVVIAGLMKQRGVTILNFKSFLYKYTRIRMFIQTNYKETFIGSLDDDAGIFVFFSRNNEKIIETDPRHLYLSSKLQHQIFEKHHVIKTIAHWMGIKIILD